MFDSGSAEWLQTIPLKKVIVYKVIALAITKIDNSFSSRDFNK